MKTRLTGEAEDLAHETEQERVELRAKEKAAKAMVDIMKERRLALLAAGLLCGQMRSKHDDHIMIILELTYY